LREILGGEVQIVAQAIDSIDREPSGKLRPLVNLYNLVADKRLELATQLGVASLLPITSRDAALSIVHRGLACVLPAYTSVELSETGELFADLGMDSLRFVHLIAYLEEQFGREINDEDLFETQLVTVGDLVTFVERIIQG
jgi:acyl carrier protein